jgi:DNA-binding transcriptional ArsR family regulator
MHDDPLSIQLSALADPTRRAILARLSKGEMTVNDLAAPFAMSLPAISRHLKVLENAGLVSRSRAAQWRPAKLEPLAMKGIADWIDQYRHFWEPSFERLDAYLKSIQSGDDDGSRH